MIKFLRLQSGIINISHINSLFFGKNKYYMYLSHHKIESIEICKIKSPEDYKKITEWIKKLDEKKLTTHFYYD